MFDRLFINMISSSYLDWFASRNLPQNGEVDRTKGSRLPEPTNNRPKSPVLLPVSEDSSSRSSSSQKRNEKLKSQNGYSKIDEKLKKVAAAATTPCSDGSRNASVAEVSILTFVVYWLERSTCSLEGMGLRCCGLWLERSTCSIEGAGWRRLCAESWSSTLLAIAPCHDMMSPLGR